MNYLPTIIMFRYGIAKAFPDVKAKKGLDNLPSHILWMLIEIEDNCVSDKVDRWIGYICRCLEELKIFNNSQIQFIIRNNNKNLKEWFGK